MEYVLDTKYDNRKIALNDSIKAAIKRMPKRYTDLNGKSFEAKPVQVKAKVQTQTKK